MNDLSPEARRTLAQAKSAQPRASHAMRARVKENVLRAVAAAPAASLGEDLPLEDAGNSNATGVSKSAFAKLPVWALPTLGAIAVIGGIATFGAQRAFVDHSSALEGPAPQVGTVELQRSADRHLLDDRKIEQGSAPVDARSAGEDLPGAEAAVAPAVEDSRAPDATAPTTRAKTRAHGKPSAFGQPRAEREPARDGDLRAEMQLLARAEAALRANEPRSALSILDAHASEFSSGQLQGERDGLRLIAHCALGRSSQSALARYLREHPDGVLQGRIRASCARFLP